MLRLLCLDDIQMIDVVVAGCFVRKMDVAGVAEARGVAQHSGLQVIQAAVVAHAVAGSLAGPVVAQLADCAVDMFVVGDDRAAAAKVDRLVKTGGGRSSTRVTGRCWRRAVSPGGSSRFALPGRMLGGGQCGRGKWRRVWRW
jgi:hypothetical protein